MPAATLEAFSRSQAIIEFTPEGQVLTANALFLELLGYSLSEIVGRPHSIFVDDAEAATTAYGDFWPALARGEFQAREFRRITKAGEAVYIQASYNPVIVDGKVVRVVKIATDITATKMAAADAQGQMAAVHRAQAVIEFDLNGKVTAVNDNFCKALGYTPAEIVGKHHRMFVEPQFAASPEYASFWDHLREGQFHADEFLRIGKGGKRVWIQASYNPVYDPEGRLWKVVKFATDTTARKQAVEIIGNALGELAAGRLDCRIEERLPDELEIVADALNETVDRLKQMVSGIRISAQALRAATGEILAGSNDLADRTSRQAAAVEETSAAVEQLTQTVTQNADRAAVTKSEALTVSSIASECGTVMGEADAAMHRISDSSAKIASIVEMIDDIAFQTNLLALNASVEAARAGDAGKGFAVVAVEVRRLAQSSAVASHDIKALVDASSVEVACGTRLVGEASSRVQRVLEGISRSTALVEEIARACHDQASAISEVSISVRQMDEMTQHNAALVEQTNAAIEQTEGQANALEGYVEQFSLSGKTSFSNPEKVVALRA